MAVPNEYWERFSVALVDAYDAHVDGEATPVPVGDVVRRLQRLETPPSIVVYSANFDNPYFNRYVRDSTNARAYYDAASLLQPDGVVMRSALLDDEPRYQAAVPTADDIGDLGDEADLAEAITALHHDPRVWRWALGLTPWTAVDAYRRRKVRSIARDTLRMAPPERPMKVRDGLVLHDMSPDHGSIIRVIQAALGLSRGRR